MVANILSIYLVFALLVLPYYSVLCEDAWQSIIDGAQQAGIPQDTLKEAHSAIGDGSNIEKAIDDGSLADLVQQADEETPPAATGSTTPIADVPADAPVNLPDDEEEDNLESPQSSPTKAPKLAPTNAPVGAPKSTATGAPKLTPTKTPTNAPAGAPKSTPNAAPKHAPLKATSAPTKAPAPAPYSYTRYASSPKA